jgi:hypothetical protein
LQVFVALAQIRVLYFCRVTPRAYAARINPLFANTSGRTSDILAVITL